LKSNVLWGHARLRDSFCAMKSGRRGFGNKGQCISWRFPALLAFVDIGVKVDIGYETVKHRTSGLDHTIRKLRAHAHRVCDASDALDFSNFDKIKGFDLLDDRTKK
jgi:hypothetical protein